MRKHLGNIEAGMFDLVLIYESFGITKICADISDPLSYASYFTVLRGVAGSNSSLFDEIEGETSVYRCRNVKAYKDALSHHRNRSIHDPSVREAANRISGFLIFFPLDFLCESTVTDTKSSSKYPQSLWI
jgi:hypothetical protein